MFDEYPRQGEIYYAYLPNRDLNAKSDKHRVIVVSRDELNRGNDVVVIPLTSRNLDRHSRQPHCVMLAAGECQGITEDSAARCEMIVTVDIDEIIDFESGVLGSLPEGTIEDLADGTYCIFRYPD